MLVSRRYRIRERACVKMHNAIYKGYANFYSYIRAIGWVFFQCRKIIFKVVNWRNVFNSYYQLKSAVVCVQMHHAIKSIQLLPHDAHSLTDKTSALVAVFAGVTQQYHLRVLKALAKSFHFINLLFLWSVWTLI